MCKSPLHSVLPERYHKLKLSQRPQWTLQVMQAILLCEFYGRFRGSRAAARASEPFQSLYSRVSSPFSLILPPSVDSLTCFAIRIIFFVLFCHLPPNLGNNTQRLPRRWPPLKHQLITTTLPAPAMETGMNGLLPNLAGDFSLLLSFLRHIHPCTMNTPSIILSLLQHPRYP